MSSVYTGVGGNVSQSTSPTITVPADGDSLAVTSVNTSLDKLMDYIALLFGGAQTGQTSSTPGYAGTGGASAQGLKGTAGGGSSPVKGMLNLVPTTNAPSSPDNGDLWATTAGVLGARLNGNTRTLANLEEAQTFSGVKTGTNLAKAWAKLTLGAAGAVTVTKGFNVASSSWATTLLTVNFTTAMADTNYIVYAYFQSDTTRFPNVVNPSSASTFDMGRITYAGVSSSWVSGDVVHVLVFN